MTPTIDPTGRRFHVYRTDAGDPDEGLIGYGIEFPTGTAVVEPVAEDLHGVLPYEGLDSCLRLLWRAVGTEVYAVFEDGSETERRVDGPVPPAPSSKGGA